jgi:diguanylate cyclase
MRSKILDYVDFERADALLEGFNKTTGFVTALVDLDGNILSQSGWRDICTDFHRKHPKTVSNCLVSDTVLHNRKKTDEKYHFYKCKNGLIDVAMPILIKGEHIANLFTGQFFFEKPDISFFKTQAHTYGFEEKAYLEALEKVPVVSKEKVETAMDFLIGITRMIMDMTAEKMEQLQINDAVRKSEEALFESQVQLKQNVKDLAESQRIAHVGTWRLDLATNQVVWSEELYKMYGFDSTVPPPPYTEHMKLFTPESWERLSSALEQTRTLGIPYELELNTVVKDGSNGWMWVRGEAETDSEGNIVAIWGAAQDITRYKKIEYEIRQSEEKFQLLFNKAPLGYQSLDFDGYFIDVNQQWVETLGYRKDEVIGKWFGDFLCPEYVEGFRQRFPIFKAQGYIHSEFDMWSKDRQRLTIAFEGKIGYDAEGEFKQTHCILQDITLQRKAEKALIESEARYKYLFEHSGVGIGYYTVEGVVISYNKKALGSLGGKPEDYIGKSVREIFPKEEAEKFFTRIQEAVINDEPQQYEDSLMAGTDLKWFSNTFTKVKNVQDEIVGIQVASIDITRSKQAEETLMESQAILQAAFENSQAGIAIADAPGGRLRYANKAGLLIRDKSEEELVKDVDIHTYVSSWKILHFDGTPFAEDEVPLARAILYGETCSREFMVRRDNLEDRYVLASASPIKDSNGNITAAVVVFIDLTEKMRIEEEIKRQNQLFASLLKLLPVGVFMVDAADGKPLVVNDMGKTLLGRGVLPDATEHNLSEVYKAYKGDTSDLYPPEQMPIVLGMKGISSHIDDMVVQQPEGQKILLEVFGTPVNNAQGKPWASLVTFMDITERKRAENELIYLSYHDHLTGFYNRRFFEEELKQLDTAENLPLSVIICDINGLKLINDSFGHSYGDQLIVETAKVIRIACPADGIISRIGGDEFALLLPKTRTEEAGQIANAIKELASKENVQNVELSISFGHDTKASDKQNILEVMANAENYMYRHKLYERSSTRSKTIEIIMNTLFEKSTRESMHSSRVSGICKAIASRMKLNKDDVNKIRIAGLVHDIGKIGIDERILNKVGELSGDEKEQIRRHPEIGWRILSSANEFSELAQFILNHHERWDGHGYPNGLKGEEIPIESRIIAVADAYDAMTGERSYRPAISQKEAIKELERCSGAQFDPQIIKVLLEQVLREG